MNSRQAARAANKRIEELERVNRLYSKDVGDYISCILHMINHGSPCNFCHDYQECKDEGKDLTIGCDQWMLKSQEVEKHDT